MMTTTRDESMQIARTIVSQIPVGVKMSVGLREVWALDRGLTAKVGPGQRRLHLEIALNHRDLYDVRVYRIRRGDAERVDVYRAEDVYAEDLGRTLLDAEREGWGQ